MGDFTGQGRHGISILFLFPDDLCGGFVQYHNLHVCYILNCCRWSNWTKSGTKKHDSTCLTWSFLRFNYAVGMTSELVNV